MPRRPAPRPPVALGAALVLLCCGDLVAQPTTTVITHGYQLDATFPDWPVVMGSRIADRSSPPGTVLVLDPATGGWSPVYGSNDPAGAIVLCFDWAECSAWTPGDGTRVGTAVAAADTLHASLRDPRLLGPLAGASVLVAPGGGDRPLHLIGHSRGASLNTAVVERLVGAGIAVDHLTFLDPHPIGPSANLLDPAMVVHEGVVFADNYYRADGCDIDHGCFFFDFDGEPVAGAWNLDLGLDAFGFVDNRLSPCSLEHILVHTWYHGTIDLLAGTDGDCSIDRQDWYTAQGAGEGFFFSQLGGGLAQRPCGPGGGCADAGRVPVAPTPAIVNGDFEFGSGNDAGWLWHGGGGPGVIAADASGPHLELNGGASWRRHDRFHLPSDAAELTCSIRVLDPDPGAVLEILLRDDGIGPEELLGSRSLSTATGWQTEAFDLAAVPLDRAVTLEVRVSPANTAARVSLDDFDLTRGSLFRRGDCNEDTSVDLADPISLLNALFGGAPLGSCASACDANDDGALDISDPVTILEHLFGGGGPLPPPSPACGPDPSPAGLTCLSAGACLAP